MSLCIIVADGDHQEGKGLELTQVIEALAYNKKQESVLITFDFLLKNDRNDNCRILVVHRGLASLETVGDNLVSHTQRKSNPSSWKGDVPRDDVLREIYNDRIIKLYDNSIGFLERKNCYIPKDTPTTIDHLRPDLITLKNRLVWNGKGKSEAFPLFSAFEVDGIRKGNSWFRVKLRISGLTYDYLIKHQIHFWVDGPERVMKQIRDEDIPLRGFLQPEAANFFYSEVQSQQLRPKAYDVVIFRPGTEGVDVDTICEPVTGDLYESTLNNESVKRRARLYVTRSPEFWLDVCYADEARVRNSPISGKDSQSASRS